MHPDTYAHCFYFCPANHAIESEHVQDTQDLITDDLQDKIEEYPCLWLRGILPLELVPVPEHALPPKELAAQFSSSGSVEPQDQWGSGTYFGDASGGANNMYPSIRRCGCGLVFPDSNGSPLYSANFNLPGKIQTVARAELFVLVYLMRIAQRSSCIHFVTDNLKNSETFNKGPEHADNTINRDLFSEIFKLVSGKSISLTVSWMPSHQDKKDPSEWPSFLTQNMVKANKAADEEAEKAAIRHEVPINVSTPIKFYNGLVKKIQLRLASIILALPAR